MEDELCNGVDNTHAVVYCTIQALRKIIHLFFVQSSIFPVFVLISEQV